MSVIHRATWYSPAKVNLCLRIVGRRADGYHLLDSVFAAIDLCDRVHLEVDDVGPSVATEISVACDHPGVPEDATNLAARAAARLLEHCGLGGRVAIRIEKRIPPGAGLGGGSSNAATVLCYLNETLQLAVPERRLHDLGLQLGADVPFFLTGGCARVRGIGEQVESIPGWPGLSLVVALPPVVVSTAWAFREFAGLPVAIGDEAARLAGGATPDVSTAVNDLEPTVFGAFPLLRETKESLLAAGAGAAVMSGSGAAVVGLVSSPQDARSVAAAFAARHPDTPAHCVRVLPAAPPSVDPASAYA